MGARSARRRTARRGLGCLLAGVLVAVLAGCAASRNDSAPAGDRAAYLPSRADWRPGLRLPPAGGARDVPITPRAVATVALSVLPGNTRHRWSFGFSGKEQRQGYVGAELTYTRFPGAPESDPSHDSGGDDEGWPVTVALEPPGAPSFCAAGHTCARLGSRHGRPVTMAWFPRSEDDPGEIIVFTTRRDGWTVWCSPGFDDVGRDPRHQQLTVGLATLGRLVSDPRLAPRTDAALVRAGAALPRWEGQG